MCNFVQVFTNGNLKKEISRVVKKDGIVLTFGWNSGGIGKSNGFNVIEILLVAHGGWHNDTIVTVDKKSNVMSETIKVSAISDINPNKFI